VNGSRTAFTKIYTKTHLDGGAEIARPDNPAPYRKGGHRETLLYGKLQVTKRDETKWQHLTGNRDC